MKVNGNQVDIRDYRGNISMVHITDVKKTTLTDQVADDNLQLCNEEHSQRSVCQEDTYLTSTGPPYTMTRIKSVKQEQDPTETTVTPATPAEFEGPPSSHLRSKTKQQSTKIKQGKPECNPTPLDLLEHNPARVEVNNIQVGTEYRNTLVEMALTLLGVAKAISDQF